MRCLLVLATSVLIFSSLTASSASAGEGIQFVGPKMLINRDIGGERWAITVSPLAADDPAERNSMAITGNVLRPDGQPPAAIDCQQDSDFPDIGTGVRLTCRAKNACQTLSDSCVLYSKEWTELGEVVVPYSFFELRRMVAQHQRALHICLLATIQVVSDAWWLTARMVQRRI